MTPIELLVVAAAGGAGAAARFTLEGAVRMRLGTSLPWGTIIVNASGSLLLGFCAGLAVHGLLPDQLQMVFRVGFLGGYTTFSAASYETVQLLRERKYGLSLVNGVGVLVGCALLAAAGMWLGSLL